MFVSEGYGDSKGWVTGECLELGLLSWSFVGAINDQSQAHEIVSLAVPLILVKRSGQDVAAFHVFWGSKTPPSGCNCAMPTGGWVWGTAKVSWPG